MSNARNIASGSKFVDTAGDTMTGGLNVTGGNLGAGTSSPNQTLTVADPNHGLSLDYVGATLPAAAGLYTSSTAHTQQAYGDLNIKSRSDYSGYGIGMYTASSNNTPTLRMKIDSSGRVTMPYQPAFHVGVSSNQTLAAGDTVVFQQQFENRGSHYNTSNGLFTAPVTGFYSFTYRLLHESVSNGHAVDSYLSKNNSATAGNAFLSQRYKYQADYTGHTGYLSESSSGMIYLAANDTMRVRYSGGQNSTIHNNQNWSYFCGHLVG